MKLLPWIVFSVTVLAQWAAPVFQIWTHEQVLMKGTIIKLKCSAPDPYDPLRGRFLAVRPEQTEASLPEGLKLASGSQVYITLTPGADGISTITGLSLDPPRQGTFLRVHARSSYDNKARITWPFDRFYINEKLAPEADRWFAENIRSTQGIIAEVRVYQGRAVLADLILDDKRFREILKARIK